MQRTRQSLAGLAITALLATAATAAESEQSAAKSTQTLTQTQTQPKPRQRHPMTAPMAPQRMPYGMPYGMPYNMPPQQWGAAPYGYAPAPGMTPYAASPYGAPPYGAPMGRSRPPNFGGPNGYRAPAMNPSFNPPTMEPPWGNNKSFDMSPMKFWPVPGTGNPWHYKPWEPGAPWGDSGKFSDPPDEAFHEAEDFLADAPRMPGGWELPNISMPSPFEIGEQVGDQSWLLPENFKMRDKKRPSRYRKYFQNEN